MPLEPSPVAPPEDAPSGPQLGVRPRRGLQPNPVAVAAAALAAGILLARLIDWRGRARARA